MKTVKLSTEEAVDATLVFMAIHALGKINEFREEFVAGMTRRMHDVALAQILRERPEVVPSFQRLSEKWQALIVDSLSVDFQFSQFLQAEITPANLVIIKEKLQPHREEGFAFAFFCFRIFAQMCGKLGNKSLKGSLFMDESQFRRFLPGLDALEQLRTRDAEAAYNSFLLGRGSKALSRFASPEHQALSRLLCLGKAYDHEGGYSVCAAFDELAPEERASLTRWLNSNGIAPGQPGFVLCDAPALFQNAKENPSVGLAMALRILLRVQKECVAPSITKDITNVAVQLGAIADWAKECSAEQNFLATGLVPALESDGDAQVLAIHVDHQAAPTSVLVEESPQWEVTEPEQSPRTEPEPESPPPPPWPLGDRQSLILGSASIVLLMLSMIMMGSQASVAGKALAFLLLILAIAAAALLGQRWLILNGGVDQAQGVPGVTGDIGPREPFLPFDLSGLHPRRLSHQYSRLRTFPEGEV